MNVSHFDNMDSDSESEAGANEFNQILYDIVTYKEWEQEPEVVKTYDRHTRLSSKWLSTPSPQVLPASVERLGSIQLPWHLAVSADASLIAVLSENALEIWSSRENYSQLVGRRQLERDSAPQWRHIVWTHDCSLLVMANSSGAVEVCDTVGNQVYQLISPRIEASQPGWADTIRNGPIHSSYAGVFFSEARVRDKLWISELILVDYSGHINSFLVSLTGYQELSSYFLGWSLTTATFCSPHNLLLTAGGPDHPLAGKRQLVGRASHAGIVVYRLINESPHYMHLLDSEEQGLLVSRVWLPSFPFVSSSPVQDFIIKMSISTCGSRLAALHQSGSLTVWQIPSMVLESSTKLVEQPLHDECNPQLLQAPDKRKAKQEFLSNPLRYHPVGVSWWNSESVVLARVSGALSVLGIQDLLNLLGESPEFLEGVPRISQCFQKGFFGLECESVVRGRRASSRDDSAGEDPDVELEVESDEDEDSWLSLGKRSAAAVAYYITDSERFAPPRKKAKIVRKTYRMLALVSTSPEELFNRKILLEEYGEAIMLAQHYGLDTDPVYSRQWQQSIKSVAAIHDYLSKMKKRSEVLKECTETIPNDIDAVRELLEYGLKATDLEALIAVGTEEDTGELVLADKQRIMCEVDSIAEKVQLERKEKLKLISKVRWESLTLVQKDLINTRFKLLYYLDCLHTYEDILGGGQRASERFSNTQYSQIRARNPVENCLFSARQGDSTAVLALLGGRHAQIIAKHWLPVLAMFPETLEPSKYSELLPCIGEDGVEPLFRHTPREQDWCESALAVKWGGVRLSVNTDILYQDQPELEQFCTEQLTPGMISKWYEMRARQIVQTTSLPDIGLQLLTLGLERGATIHWKLLHNLRTLDCLVYEVQESLDLDDLEQFDSIQQMDHLLSNHPTVLGVRKYLQPFLQRLEDNIPGEMRKLVHQLCVSRAHTDLTFPLVVVENSGPDKTGPVLYSVTDTVRLALDCCYANTSGTQVDVAEKIYLAILPYFKENPGTGQLRYNLSNYRDELENFKTHLEVCRILTKNGVMKSLAHIRNHIGDSVTMKKLFDAITARAEGAKPPLEQDGWRSVLRDLQLLQSLISCVSMNTVILGYTESLLSSGSSSNIDLAGSVLEGVVDSDDTIKLILTAWRHYYSSSGGLGDVELDLARQCLSLAPPGNREIQDCYDLIAALQSLSDFGLDQVLPISVLECKDRMELVEQAVKFKPTSYKNSQRLMKLATLLRVNGGEPVEGMVWASIANRALKVGDYSTSQTACNNFMLAGFIKGWDICYALATQGNFSDLDKCSELLAFAVSHCPKENISDIMKTIVTVEQKNLTSKLSSKISTGSDHPETGTEDEDIFDDAVEETYSRESREPSPLEHVLSIPSLSSQFFMENPITANMVEKSSKWLSQLATTNMERSYCEDQLIDLDFNTVRIPSFYASLFPANTCVSALDPTYTKFSRPLLSQDLGVASYQIYRINCLSESLITLSQAYPESNLNFINIPKDLLEQLLPLLASQDLLVGLSLLLSAPSDASIHALSTLPRTYPSLCLCLVYLSILILQDNNIDALKVFSCSPENLITSALSLPSEASLLSTELHSYLDLVTDYHQGNQLSGLAGQVDVERFTSDYQYKEDTILGLAMFTEKDKWSLTLSLAKRYSLPLWVVYATHLETILTSTMSSDDVEVLVNERDLISILKEDASELTNWMRNKVLPLVDGNDSDRLLLCYTLLVQAGSIEHHKYVEALRLIRENKLLINFNLLEEGNEHILDNLTDDTVDIIAQITGIMKVEQMKPSRVYHSWAFKVFRRHGEEKDNWIEAFSLCNKFMENMSTSDFESFVRQCLLSSFSLKSVPRPARGRIFKKALKFVEVKIAAKAVGDWTAVENWLHVVRSHSDRLKQQLSVDLISNIDDKFSDCIDEFEMTGGNEVEILKLLAKLILVKVDPIVPKSLIQVWKQDRESETLGIVEILKATVDQILKNDDEISTDPFHLLENLLEYFRIPSTVIAESVVPLCTNENIPVNHRLCLVKLVQNLDVDLSGDSALENSQLTLLYETQHDFQKIIPDLAVEKSDLQDISSKWHLFVKAVNLCSTTEQLMKLYRIIQKWDDFEEKMSQDPDKNCILILTKRMIAIDENGIDLGKLLENTNDLNFPQSASENLLSHAGTLGRQMLYAQIILRLRLQDSYDNAIEILVNESCCDDDTLKLIVSRGLTCKIVRTSLYNHLVQRMSDDYDESFSQQVRDQLTQEGHTAQALSLQMFFDAVPAGLRTMASVVQRLRGGDNVK